MSPDQSHRLVGSGEELCLALLSCSSPCGFLRDLWAGCAPCSLKRKWNLWGSNVPEVSHSRLLTTSVFSIGDGMRLRFSASPMKGLFSVCIKQLGEFGAATVCWNPSVVLNSRALTHYIFHGSQVNTTHGLRATPPSNQKNRGARRKDYCGFEMCSALNLL